MNGGYIMIDCKKMNLLAQSTQTISGLYAKSMDALKTGKPVIANNCEYGAGVPMSPVPVFGIIESGTIIFTASILQIRVDNNDAITITSLIQSARAGNDDNDVTETITSPAKSAKSATRK